MFNCLLFFTCTYKHNIVFVTSYHYILINTENKYLKWLLLFEPHHFRDLGSGFSTTASSLDRLSYYCTVIIQLLWFVQGVTVLIQMCLYVVQAAEFWHTVILEIVISGYFIA